MDELGKGVVVDIAKIVLQIQSDLVTNNEEIYLVLGSDGDLFSVEICSGEFASRKIIKLIHIEIKPKQEQTYELKDIIQLSTAAEWNAFIKLLSIAVPASKIEICHPLDGSGNFLTDWNAAVEMVSTNNGKLNIRCEGNVMMSDHITEQHPVPWKLEKGSENYRSVILDKNNAIVLIGFNGSTSNEVSDEVLEEIVDCVNKFNMLQKLN